MTRSDRTVAELRAAVAEVLGSAARRTGVVLAVSGGIDSMVLLDAAVATLARGQIAVATFDHATGPSATQASAFVVERAALLGVECVRARARDVVESEASLRMARWAFLHAAASGSRAIATAHLRDDQLETVLMRVMRGAGARGLAGLYARSAILRPLLRFTRSDVSRYAAAHELDWIEDPSNLSRRYLRNRVRHDLLPAIRAVHPTIDTELLAVAERAATWRRDSERIVDRLIGERGACVADEALDVPSTALVGRTTDELSVLWPAIAARSGLALDRRGTIRLAQFTTDGRVGARIQLSGGWEVIRSRSAFQLRRGANRAPRERALAVARATRWGRWTFYPPRAAAREGFASRGDDRVWSATLPADKPLSVRAWRPGDAMVPDAGAGPRRVKRLLSAAGVTGYDRAGWPVVLAGEEIVWIPGVRRGQCAGAQPDRLGLAFVCERLSR